MKRIGIGGKNEKDKRKGSREREQGEKEMRETGRERKRRGNQEGIRIQDMVDIK